MPPRQPTSVPPFPALPEARLPAQANHSLWAGIDCLLQLVSADGPVGCGEVAGALGMELTRVNRLLGTLAAMGLATRTRDRKYAPGPGLHVLSAMSLRGSHLLAAALPELRRLSSESGHAVALGVLWQRQVCYLFHGGGERPLDAGIAAANLYPAERSSIGRILLGHRDPADVRQRFPHLANLDAFIDQLARDRQQGHSLSADRSSLAVAVGNPPIAGLAIMGPWQTGAPPTLVDRLTTAAHQIANATNNNKQ